MKPVGSRDETVVCVRAPWNTKIWPDLGSQLKFFHSIPVSRLSEIKPPMGSRGEKAVASLVPDNGHALGQSTRLENIIEHRQCFKEPRN